MKPETGVLAALVVSLVFVACGSSARASAATSPLTLSRHTATVALRSSNRTFVAALPEIGTVYSRYNCTRGWRFALGIHVSGPQSTAVRFRTGSMGRDREVQPGQTAWFGYSLGRVQWLAAAATGENGTVVGWVRVTGYPSSGRDCAAYTPPRITIQVYPRRYYRSPDYPLLRHLIG